MRYSLCLLLLLSAPSFAWWDPSFQYRSAINITSASALTDYQVQIDPKLYNNTGLVGSWHFSEGAGTRAADSSGSSNDGTLVGSPAWVPGKFGNGLQFNGASSYMSVPMDIDSDSVFSFDFWLYDNSTSNSGYRRWVTTTNGGVGANSVMIREADGGYVQIYAGGTVGTGVTGGGWWKNAWHHFAYVSDGVNSKVYVDGNLTPIITAANSVNPEPNLYIGGYYTSGPSEFFRGTIDELRIYNRSLSVQEISEHYNASKARLDYADLRFTQPYTIYETPISISGTGSNLTDYQVLVNITNATILSHMRADGADLRFFSSATSAPYSSSGLSYWIETITSSQAKVWVKANVSSGGSTLYMYYGNVSASAQSNGTNTFNFFDDFNVGPIAPSKWSITNGVGTINSNGEFDVNGAVGNWGTDGVLSTYVITRPSSISWDARFSSGSNLEVLVGLGNSIGLVNPNLLLSYEYSTNRYIAINGAHVSSSFGAWTPEKKHYRLDLKSPSGFSIYENGVLLMDDSTWTPDNLKFHVEVYTDGGHIYLDNFRVHTFSAVQPSAVLGSETVSSSGNEAPLSYWLESDKKAWVKSLSLPAGQTTPVYMYYGSPSASSFSNGSATFDGFDRFDADTWTDTGSLVYVDTTNQRLYAKADRSATAHRSAKPVGSLADFNLTFDLNIISYNGDSGTLYIGIGDANANLPSDFLGIAIYQWLGQPLAYAYKREGGAQDARTETGMGSSYPRNGKVVLWRNGTTVYASYTVGAAVAEYTWTGTSLGNLNYFIAYNNNDGAVPASWVEANSDNWMLRKYASPSPSLSGGVEQQVDVTPPAVSISSPASATYSSLSLPLNFSASDVSGISSCKYELNGINTTLADCLNATITASSGSNSLTLWAFDGSNWGSASVLFNVSLDTIPPSISISSPEPKVYSAAPVPVAFVVSDASAYSCVVRLNGTVNYSSCANSSLSLGNGAYILNITANDTFGNANSSAVSFTVNLTVFVSNSTTTNSNGIGNVSLSGIPPAASRIVYSVGSNSFTKAFSVSSGVSSVRISAKATLQGTPVPGKTLAFAVS